MGSAGDSKDFNATNLRGFKNEASFMINGKPYKVSDLPVDTSLNTFIRNHAHLRGTKFMCLEGGCGACIVSATAKLLDGTLSTFAINSCLVPVYSCHGWAIETVESLGDRIDGYGPVQSRLAKNNGTQCGYCSPGMVMNMYSLLKTNKEMTMKEIENSFGGNICRCTGYRPILDAFKSFASDAPKELTQKCIDIEEAEKICSKTNKPCSGNCHHKKSNSDCFDYDLCADVLPIVNKKIKLELSDGKDWYRVTTKKEIFEILVSVDSYMLVGGNTAHGAYRSMNKARTYIDVSEVDELHFKCYSEESIVLGANITLTEAMKFFYCVSKNQYEKFGYAKDLANHIDLVANVPVRNVGTLAGNLTIKYQHREFPSDIFVILEGIGAQLVIESVIGTEEVVTLMEFLAMNMNKKVITKIILPAINSMAYKFKTYKIMPRSQNAHAYVNAAFLFKTDAKDKLRVLERPNIVFGSISPQFVHAKRTEGYLQGKRLLDGNVIQEALKILQNELYTNYVPPDASAEYRKGLALSLFYKFILSLSPQDITKKNKSGGEILSRSLSSGKQEFDTDEKVWPLNQPVPKIEAHSQCSGEAEFVNDIKKIPGELFGAVLVAEKAVATSFNLDFNEALKIRGVVAIYTAKDIPGINDYMPNSVVGVVMTFIQSAGEEIFAAEKVLYAGQALGVVIAETQAIAEEAAKKVKVKYFGLQKPMTDFIEIANSGKSDRIVELFSIDRTTEKGDIKYKVKGQIAVKGQYHYSMETQSCVCVPTEDGIDVYSSTQCPTIVHGVISKVLNIPENSINTSVRRVGGAYGAKVTRSAQVAAISALATHLTKRPVRIVLSLEANMQMVGKRLPAYFQYEADVNDDGQIQKLSGKIYQDVGINANEAAIIYKTMQFITALYNSETWSVKFYSVRTDTASNTWFRAPGCLEAVALKEHLMEHIASVVKKDPLSVKLANMMNEHTSLVKMIDDVKVSSEYEKRLAAVNMFNQDNRWRKRGMSLVPLVYPIEYFGRYHASITVFSFDGTVSISHGGIECGQGMNTKIAQVCAYVLGIPLENVKIKPTSSLVSASDGPTAASIGSEVICYAVKKGCEEILQRLEPIKKNLPAQASWLETIKAAYLENVDLHVNFMYKVNDEVKPYVVHGVTVFEVEVDILTGQNQIIRVDLVEDAGQSISPQVDIGQVEGAFVQGLGYYLTESLVYDRNTGKLLTDRSWNYKTPGAKDIPIDFRIQFLRNSKNPFGVFRSKATGEPPLGMTVGVVFALRNAIRSARKDAGNDEDWFDLAIPASPEHVWLSALTDIKSMTL